MTDLTPDPRERLRRTVEDGKRLYRKRMHSEPTIADDNRIDGILTLDLPAALAALDAERARTERFKAEIEEWVAVSRVVRPRYAHLEAVAEAARALNAAHGDLLGLPTLSQDELDAAVKAWAAFRAALAVLEEPQPQLRGPMAETPDGVLKDFSDHPDYPNAL